MSPPPPTKKKTHNCAQLRTTAHNCAQRTTAHNFAQLRTMVDFIVLSIQLVFMVLCVSYSRVLYNKNSMILYFKHIIHIDEFPLLTGTRLVIYCTWLKCGCNSFAANSTNNANDDNTKLRHFVHCHHVTNCVFSHAGSGDLISM